MSWSAQSEVSTDIKIDLEEFEELWVEKAEKVAAKKKVSADLVHQSLFTPGRAIRFTPPPPVLFA